MCVPGEHKESVDRILDKLAQQADPTATLDDLTEIALLELSSGLDIPCTEPACFRDIAFDWAVTFKRSQITLVQAA